MKKVLVLLTLFVAVISIVVARAQTRTVSWGAVTTYTDGTSIEAGNTVTYSIWMQDNVTKMVQQISNRITGVSQTFDDASLVKGRTYNFWAAAFLATGASSDNSAIYAWVNPTGRAATPAGLVVQ